MSLQWQFEQSAFHELPRSWRMCGVDLSTNACVKLTSGFSPALVIVEKGYGEGL